MSRIFAKVCKKFEGSCEADHLHLQVVDPPKVAPSKLINGLKGVSSRLLGQWRPEVRGRSKDGVLRSPSSFVASGGGAPLTLIAETVNSQRDAASGRSRLPPRADRWGVSRGNR